MAGTGRTAELQEGLTPMVTDWFERVHGQPRTKLEYGTIVAQTDKDYEVYNASRDQTATISSITNNALPGMSTPDVTPPHVLSPGESTRDSTSTSNSGTSGLGTFVKSKLRAAAQGLSEFDTSVVFNTELGSITILVSGFRIEVFVPRYESPVRESLSFLTDVLEKIDGSEQRISSRQNYRETLEVTYLLDASERQRMQALLMGDFDATIGVPIFHEEVDLASDVSASTLTYPVTGADDVDFRVGGFGIALQDETTFDLFEIDAATDTLITAKTASVNGYSAGTPIIPLRTYRIASVVQGQVQQNSLETFRIVFEATDNATGALSGSTAAFSSYSSRVLLDDCNLFDGSVTEEYRQRVHVIDNSTGIVYRISPWTRSKRTHQKGFRLHTRLAVKNVKQLLVSLRGRQKSFWIPTFQSDMTIKAALTSGSPDVDVTHLDYVDRIADSGTTAGRNPKKIFKITFNDGTGAIVREVVTSAEIDATTERLTTNANLGVNKATSTIDRVEFYEPVRFDTDTFVITREGDGRATLTAPVKVVFDAI